MELGKGRNESGKKRTRLKKEVNEIRSSQKKKKNKALI